MNGWVKLHKKILDNDIFRHDRTAWHIFETILILADSETGKWSGGLFQLSELTGEKKDTVYKALLRLSKARMITRSVNTRYTVYNISKWSEYQQNGKQPVNTEYTAGKQPVNTEYTAGKQPVKLFKDIDIEKDIDNSKELAKPVYGKLEINELFEYWQEKTGLSVSSQVQANRRACSNLFNKHGTDNLKRLIDGVAQAHNDQYAPRIANFIQLQSKADELILWGKQKTTNKKVVKI